MKNGTKIFLGLVAIAILITVVKGKKQIENTSNFKRGDKKNEKKEKKYTCWHVNAAGNGLVRGNCTKYS